VLACTLIALLPELGQMSRKQVAALVGLAPYDFDSGKLKGRRQHGLWWAYEGDLPPPEAFQTHGRPRHVPILGPYPSRTIAEALLRRHLERRRD
jgi:hypothetical protein